ncbi:MAG: hypothetical protein WCI05_10280, partial [Myxococcales bacterium]
MSCPQCGHSYAHHDNCPAGNALGDIRNGVDRVASASEKQSVLQQKIADTGAIDPAAFSSLLNQTYLENRRFEPRTSPPQPPLSLDIFLARSGKENRLR